MMVFDTVRPRPVPWPVGLVVKNGSNIFSSLSAGMPVPSSSISAATMRSPARKTSERASPMFAPTPVSWRAEVRTVMSPPEPATASAALVSRLTSTWLIFHAVDAQRGQIGRQFPHDLDVLRCEDAAGEPERLLDHGIQVLFVHVELLGRGKIQQVAHDAIRPLQRDGNLMDDLLRGRIGGEIELRKVIDTHVMIASGF